MIFPAAAGSGVLPPGRFIQMGRSGDGAFPGAAELRIFLSFPLSLPDDGRLATSRNTPSGVSQEADVNRRRIHAGRQLHTSGSTERRAAVIAERINPFPTAGNGGPERRETCSDTLTAGKDRHAWNGPNNGVGAFSKSGAKYGSNPPRSKGDGSPWGHGLRIIHEKDRVSTCPSPFASNRRPPGALSRPKR